MCVSHRAFPVTGGQDFRTETFDLVTQPIEIGDSRWIAAGAFVGPGTMVRAGGVWKRGD